MQEIEGFNRAFSLQSAKDNLRGWLTELKNTKK
jgi:hypothetical protein